MTTARRRFGLLAALTLALLAALAGPAGVTAHAELLETDPADGATVDGSPSEISATFSEALLADGSGLSLRDAAGERVATGDVDPADADRLIITDVPDLAPGMYEARWTAKTDDGHLERGTWTFTVAAAASPSPTEAPAPTATAAASPTPSASPSPAPTASAAPSVSPAPSPDPDPAGGSDGGVLLPIIAGLAIVAIAGVVLLNRRGRTPAA